MRLRFFIDTANSDRLPLRVAWPSRLADGTSLLARSIAQARRLTEGTNIFVIGASAEAAAEAKRLGVASLPLPSAWTEDSARLFASPVGHANAEGADVCVTLSVRALLVSDALLLALAHAACVRGASELVTAFQGSPNGAFVPNLGVMDFHHTLDGPRWREFESKRWYHCPRLASAFSAQIESAHTTRPELLAVNQLSTLRVDSVADLWVASRILERHSHLITKETWRTL